MKYLFILKYNPLLFFQKKTINVQIYKGNPCKNNPNKKIKLLTKELHLYFYNHLEWEALFCKIIVISYGIQAYIILLKSGVDGGWGGVGDWVGVSDGGGS